MFDLTQQETTIAELAKDISFTLKEVADKYGKRHDHLMRDFKVMVSTLNEKEVSLPKFGESKFIAKTGNNTDKEFTTISMDFKTLIWFIAKFDHALRLQIVNYAFDKLQEDYNKELEVKSKELQETSRKLSKLQASKYNDYDDGWSSMSRIVTEGKVNLSVSETLDIMEAQGHCKRTFPTTTKVVPKESSKLCKVASNRGLVFNKEETLKLLKEVM